MLAYHRPATLDDALAIRAGRRRDGAGRRHRRLSGQGGARAAGATCATRTCSTSPPSPGLRGIADGRRALAHRRAHHLDRPDARRAAAAVRRAEARRARRRRRAGPEPRHDRRQPLHRLAGRRRRCPTCWRSMRRSSWQPQAAPASCRCATSSTGYRHTACRADETRDRDPRPKPQRAARGHFLKLGARRYLVISIAMVAGVVETDAADASRRAHRGRRLLGRAAAPAGAGGGADRASRSRGAPDLRHGGAFRGARADRRHPRLGAPIAAQAALALVARPARRSRRAPSGGPPDAGPPPAPTPTRIAFTVNGKPAQRRGRSVRDAGRRRCARSSA